MAHRLPHLRQPDRHCDHDHQALTSPCLLPFFPEQPPLLWFKSNVQPQEHNQRVSGSAATLNSFPMLRCSTPCSQGNGNAGGSYPSKQYT